MIRHEQRIYDLSDAGGNEMWMHYFAPQSKRVCEIQASARKVMLTTSWDQAGVIVSAAGKIRQWRRLHGNGSMKIIKFGFCYNLIFNLLD